MPQPQSILITGANRGLGLGLVKAYLGIPTVKHVFATARHPEHAEELASLAVADQRLHVLKIDVQDDHSIREAFEKVEKVVGNGGLNVLFNNAGVFNSYEYTDSVPKREALTDILDVNVVSQLIVTQVFLPLIRRAASPNEWGVHKASIVMMSSGAGSIGDNRIGSGGRERLIGYSISNSKSALNQMAKTLAVDLEPEGILCVSVTPGWVQTDMGGMEAQLTVEESCSSILETLSNLGKEHTGGFFRRDGERYPY